MIRAIRVQKSIITFWSYQAIGLFVLFVFLDVHPIPSVGIRVIREIRVQKNIITFWSYQSIGLFVLFVFLQLCGERLQTPPLPLPLKGGECLTDGETLLPLIDLLDFCRFVRLPRRGPTRCVAPTKFLCISVYFCATIKKLCSIFVDLFDYPVGAPSPDGASHHQPFCVLILPWLKGPR